MIYFDLADNVREKHRVDCYCCVVYVFVLTACAVCILRLSVGVGEVEIRGARSSAAGFIPGCVSAGERPPLPRSAHLNPGRLDATVAGATAADHLTATHPPTQSTTHTLSLIINTE